MAEAATFDPLQAYRTMVTMRLFEDAVAEATTSGEVHGEMHLATGQEAVAAALEQLLRPDDVVVSTHRPHLHALARGVDPVQLLAEILERSGLCGGIGGHMHLFAPESRFMCTGIVGAGAPLAAGYALAQARNADATLSVCLLGDGAMNQGAVLETLNLSAVWRLPLVFLCEDNGYGISVPRDEAAAGLLEQRGEAFGVPGERCDGTDPEAVFLTLGEAMARTRQGSGPSLVVATCYRYRGHYEGDFDQYRSDEEKALAMSPAQDPIAKARAQLEAAGNDPELMGRIDAEAAATVAAWQSAAREIPFPEVRSLTDLLFA